MQFFLRQFKNQFVVHLHQHLHFRVAVSVKHGNHGLFDNIGRTALHNGVDGGPLCKRGHRPHTHIKLGQIANVPQHGFDISVLARQGDIFINPFPHAAVILKIIIYVFFCFTQRYAERLCQAHGALSINDTKINGLCTRAHLVRNH